MIHVPLQQNWFAKDKFWLQRQLQQDGKRGLGLSFCKQTTVLAHDFFSARLLFCCAPNGVSKFFPKNTFCFLCCKSQRTNHPGESQLWLHVPFKTALPAGAAADGRTVDRLFLFWERSRAAGAHRHLMALGARDNLGPPPHTRPQSIFLFLGAWPTRIHCDTQPRPMRPSRGLLALAGVEGCEGGSLSQPGVVRNPVPSGPQHAIGERCVG